MRIARIPTRLGVPALAVLVIGAAALSPTAQAKEHSAANPAAAPAAVSAVPRFDHVVIVLFENTNYESIKGSSKAPYFNSLAQQGTLFTNSFGITHPSQPNYIGLFSGSQHGVTGDDCTNLTGDNLGEQLAAAGKTFKAYSEGLPKAGSRDCKSGKYRRKHAPWASFENTAGANTHVPFSAFPTDYAKLPDVSFVVPDMCNDMHDCSTGTGDTWLKRNLDGYVQWAKTHNSLLITTFDEDDFRSVNQIHTVFVGDHVKAGHQSSGSINHYSVLRTLEDMHGLPALGEAARKSPITDAWSGSTPGGSTLFADDFETDRGWTVNAAGGDTATSGAWERGDPDETRSTYGPKQIKQLGSTVSGTGALSTGARSGADYSSNDLDGGVSSVRSPEIALPAEVPAPSLRFSYNLAHANNSDADDYLRVRVIDGEQVTTVFERTGSANEVAGAWQNATADLSAFAGRTIRLEIQAADGGTASLVEAQVDDVTITG